MKNESLTRKKKRKRREKIFLGTKRFTSSSYVSSSRDPLHNKKYPDSF